MAADIGRNLNDEPCTSRGTCSSAREYAVLEELLKVTERPLLDRLLSSLRWNRTDARGAGFAFLLRKFGARCFSKESRAAGGC